MLHHYIMIFRGIDPDSPIPVRLRHHSDDERRGQKILRQIPAQFGAN